MSTDFIDRLQIEIGELREKHLKLALFIQSENYTVLPRVHQILLEQQARHMLDYFNILRIRKELIEQDLIIKNLQKEETLDRPE